MSKGNAEVRFRANKEIHKLLEDLQKDLGLAEKTTGAKLLITLGEDRIKNITSYLDDITHPLTEQQFKDLFLHIKIRILQLRKQRKKNKKG